MFSKLFKKPPIENSSNLKAEISFLDNIKKNNDEYYNEKKDWSDGVSFHNPFTDSQLAAGFNSLTFNPRIYTIDTFNTAFQGTIYPVEQQPSQGIMYSPDEESLIRQQRLLNSLMESRSMAIDSMYEVMPDVHHRDGREDEDEE